MLIGQQLVPEDLLSSAEENKSHHHERSPAYAFHALALLPLLQGVTLRLSRPTCQHSSSLPLLPLPTLYSLIAISTRGETPTRVGS